ncbi:hypothetical protein [Spirosoma rhododendri]|uniref:Immunity protein 43 domain-containing protein n=1 Tax=Spirosoma rhododendri TaxID=2728024 RepID=A0A7L5DG25_9BACT|nr:hypothetical protein [Spirosoma rhododendri]QJD77069.1 hypothetical protein HH216_00540 [Spirosoma rhododendri]
MNYYNIRNDKDPKVSGIMQGVSQSKVPERHNFEDEEIFNFFYGKDRYLRLGDIPSEQVILKNIELNPKSKLNDFLDVALLSGYIVSGKVQNILSTLHLPPYKLYDVSLYHQGQFIPSVYKWFYFNRFNGRDIIDFEKSQFDLTLVEHIHKVKIKITSYEEYERVSQQYGRLGVIKIVFNKNLNPDLNIWGTKIISTNDFISEKAIQIFQEHKVTGYKIFKQTYPVYEYQY